MMFGAEQAADLFQVIVVDLTLAGDNAIVVGLASRGLAPQDQRRAIMLGIGIATLMRVLLALVALQLLAIVGLTLAGGILLLWVAWKMFREVVVSPVQEGVGDSAAPRNTVRSALIRIAIADISMSLDNVLAVAGTARGNVWILGIGLVLSVALMGFASTVVARLLGRFPWIAWVGLAIVFYVAVGMIYAGWGEIRVRWT